MKDQLTLALLSEDLDDWLKGRSSIALPKPGRDVRSDFHSFPSTELIRSDWRRSVVAPKCSLNRSPSVSHMSYGLSKTH
jgi:hypothetical protein